jgi:hypothetical protein
LLVHTINFPGSATYFSTAVWKIVPSPVIGIGSAKGRAAEKGAGRSFQGTLIAQTRVHIGFVSEDLYYLLAWSNNHDSAAFVGIYPNVSCVIEELRKRITGLKSALG